VALTAHVEIEDSTTSATETTEFTEKKVLEKSINRLSVVSVCSVANNIPGWADPEITETAILFPGDNN
jgi:hypothetical protein